MASPAPATSPLLRIRAGIEAGNAQEVIAGVQQADTTNVTLASNVRDMITQWLKVNAPHMLTSDNQIIMPAAAPAAASPSKPAAAPAASPAAATDSTGSLSAMSKMGASAAPAAAPAAQEDDEGVQVGGGSRGWSSVNDLGERDRAPKISDSMAATAKREEMKRSGLPSPDLLRVALLRFFEGAPKGSDAALGLHIIEDDDGSGSRYLPFATLGKALDLSGPNEDVVRNVQRSIVQAAAGIFSIAPDGSGAGLLEWHGWEEFATALATIATATRDPAFEPRSIQGPIARAARGAVRAGQVRQADALASMQESLSPHDLPESTAPALRGAISRRMRLALACLVDAIAAAGLAQEAGPDAMGLVGQLPRTMFTLIFDNIDDRDRGACAFLAEILQSWDRRRCFSKRWLQDASSKFTAPKGANLERDEGKGWYALTADNLRKEKAAAAAGQGAEAASGGDGASAPGAEGGEAAAAGGAHAANKRKGVVQDDETDEAVNKHLEESRKRRAALMAKYSGKD